MPEKKIRKKRKRRDEPLPARTAKKELSATFLPWALIASLVLILYAGSFPAAFHYDDLHSIKDNPHLRSMKNVPRFFIDPAAFSQDPQAAMYRPLLLATYAVNYAIDGYNPRGWHIVNLILHMLNAGLVYIILRRLFGSGFAAVLASLWFAGHALAGESVNYVSARSTLLVTLFFLAALIYFDRAAADTARPRFLPSFITSLVFFPAAILSKENAIMLPAALVLWDVFIIRPPRPWLKRFIRLHLLFWMMALLYLGWRAALFGRVFSAYKPRGVEENLLTQMVAAVYYLGLILWPMHLSIHHGFAVAGSALDPRVVLSLVVLLILFAGAVWAYRAASGLKAAGLGIAWYLVCLLPESSIVPLTMVVNERRTYLPLVGICMIVGALIKRLLESGKNKTPVRNSVILFMALAVCFNGALVLKRNRTWGDDLLLWREAMRDAPEESAARANYGYALVQAGKFKEALVHYQAAVSISPRDERLWFYLGVTRESLGRAGEAVDDYREALRLKPDYGEAHYKLALTYDALGKQDEAEKEYKQAEAAGFLSAEMCVDLADNRQAAGDLEGAIRMYRRALQIEGNNFRAMNNLGLALDAKGRYEEALAVWQSALSLYPEQASLYMNLAQVSIRLKDPDAAEKYGRGLMEVKPGDPRGPFIMGLIAELHGNYSEALSQFNQALKLDPSLANARKHIEKIKTMGKAGEREEK